MKLRESRYIREDLVAHHVAGGVNPARHEQVTPVFDESEFWRAIDHNGLANVSSDPITALRQMAEAAEPHEVIYIQFSDCGQHIRKWSRTPFECSRKCRVAIADAQKTADPCADRPDMHNAAKSA